MMIYIGIDPGKMGALAYIDGGIVEAIPFDEVEYRGVLECIRTNKREAICCLEHVGAMPGQGVTSMFSFGENFGYIRGLLEAYRIPYQLVRPQKWKKEFSITRDKNTSIAVCKKLFPGVSLSKTERSRKENDGLAEAILMAVYAQRHF